MIEKKTIDGRGAIVMYLDDDIQPAEKDDATLIKITWDDGEIAWLVPRDDDEDEESDEGLFDEEDE